MIPFESDSRIFAKVFDFEWTEDFGRGYAENILAMRAAAMAARLQEDENGDEIEPEPDGEANQ